jgi:hypothetical protein
MKERGHVYQQSCHPGQWKSFMDFINQLISYFDVHYKSTTHFAFAVQFRSLLPKVKSKGQEPRRARSFKHVYVLRPSFNAISRTWYQHGANSYAVVAEIVLTEKSLVQIIVLLVLRISLDCGRLEFQQLSRPSFSLIGIVVEPGVV